MLAIRAQYLKARGLDDEAACDIERRTLIDRIAFKTITIQMREQFALKAMRGKDAPPPDLGKDFFTCAESLRRDELALIALDDRLAKKKRGSGADWTHEDEPEADEDHEPATH